MTTLCVSDVSLGYGHRSVLSGVSLGDISDGAVIGVLGPNGAGKSTLLRAIAGLGSYTGGIVLDGRPVSQMSVARRARQVGYLPQDLPQATSLVAYEAVVSACRAVRPDYSMQDVNAAVEQVFDSLDIRDLAFRTLNQLSGGQRQLVGLAQVIVKRPTVLLLDEPTSSLDLRWQLGVFKTVRRIVGELSGVALIALHDINLAMRHCDGIALLSDGRLQAHGPPSKAMTGETLRQAYGIDGRIELCSQGVPIAIADGVVGTGRRAATEP